MPWSILVFILTGLHHVLIQTWGFRVVQDVGFRALFSSKVYLTFKLFRLRWICLSMGYDSCCRRFKLVG